MRHRRNGRKEESSEREKSEIKGQKVHEEAGGDGEQKVVYSKWIILHLIIHMIDEKSSDQWSLVVRSFRHPTVRCEPACDTSITVLTCTGRGAGKIEEHKQQVNVVKRTKVTSKQHTLAIRSAGLWETQKRREGEREIASVSYAGRKEAKEKERREKNWEQSER